MNELKPCPFCGGEVEIYEAQELIYPYTIECQECTCHMGRYSDRDEIIETWNRRVDE